MTLNDGLHFFNLSEMKVGISDGHFQFEDNGTDICDFTFGKIFSAEETSMLVDHEIDVKVTLVDKDSGWNIALMEWEGVPDKYSKAIFKSRNNGSPVFEKGWVKTESTFISEDVIAGDHTFAHTFTVPSGASNYAVIMYPAVAKQPMHLKLKEFEVDVAEPFIGYAIKEPRIAGEQHLTFNPQYKELSQGKQGYSSLRYTINGVDQPMPCGELGKGAADISLDTTVNQISGSAAQGGEGAIKFNTDGIANVQTQLLVWNEQGTENSVQFYWATVDDKGDMTKIVGSERDFTVPAHSTGTLINMPKFPVAVEAGTRIALRSKGSKADCAFLECTSDSKPMVKVKVDFKELVTVP